MNKGAWNVSSGVECSVELYWQGRAQHTTSEVYRGTLGFRIQGSGFRVQCSGFRVQGSGFRDEGAGFRVQGSGLRVWGLGFGV